MLTNVPIQRITVMVSPLIFNIIVTVSPVILRMANPWITSVVAVVAHDFTWTTLEHGCNARCLSHITHKTAHAEASVRTRTYDLVADIRRRRHQWLGHILRLKGHRYVKEAVRAQLEMGLPGNICMDAPDLSFDELTELAKGGSAA